VCLVSYPLKAIGLIAERSSNKIFGQRMIFMINDFSLGLILSQKPTQNSKLAHWKYFHPITMLDSLL
jgi:hypothetical protein